MPRVLGIDPGTVSIDIVGLADGELWLDRTFPTREALAAPESLVRLLQEQGPLDLIAGPSGYGLPLVMAANATEADLRLAFLSREGDSGGIGGLGRLSRLLASADLPVIFTPGVIHLVTVPAHRKTNRVDLGTADKVAVAALGIWDQARRSGSSSFILLELGGAFTAAVAVSNGQIVDGIGGTSGPIGWRSGGAWDGEVAFLAGQVTKEMLFRGGVSEGRPDDLDGYVEGAHKAVLALTATLPGPDEILLSGRQVLRPEIREPLERRLSAIAPVRRLGGFASVAKEGAQGAAIIADGLAGGASRSITDGMRLREASGTALDHLRAITPDQARRRLGLPAASG
ncbi:MAG: DUF1464 family protein [Gemmatimonadota bacterium]|nr:DUF1464 family protein [Gemmatimonadota bacterium]MDH4347267.1 DUF1464 family protein [Gemmatimonadota bacterium]MDH5282417.1 DUF1464 family protein [Gemmatimonadota bacterium]